MVHRGHGGGVEALGLPIFVKPANLGSSIGVAKASDAGALGDAVRSAFEFDDHVILEEFVAGSRAGARRAWGTKTCG